MWAVSWLAILLSGPVQAGEVGAITVQQAHDMAARSEILLIDVRSPEEWQETGIAKGAHAISMHRPDFMERLQALTGGDMSRRLALICARGTRSKIMSSALARLGYQTVIDVPEGMLGSSNGPGWLKSELPVGSYSD